MNTQQLLVCTEAVSASFRLQMMKTMMLMKLRWISPADSWTQLSEPVEAASVTSSTLTSATTSCSTQTFFNLLPFILMIFLYVNKLRLICRTVWFHTNRSWSSGSISIVEKVHLKVQGISFQSFLEGNPDLFTLHVVVRLSSQELCEFCCLSFSLEQIRCFSVRWFWWTQSQIHLL